MFNSLNYFLISECSLSITHEVYLPLSLKYFRWLAIACSTDSSGQILTPLGKRMERFLRSCRCLWNCSVSMLPPGFSSPGGREGSASCQALSWGAGEASPACPRPAAEYASAVKLKPQISQMRWWCNHHYLHATSVLSEGDCYAFSVNRTCLWLWCYKQP